MLGTGFCHGREAGPGLGKPQHTRLPLKVPGALAWHAKISLPVLDGLPRAPWWVGTALGDDGTSQVGAVGA
ncbi:hypothetical protein ASNO1_38100 [Corallococcus caeni]|uniref:Uncharacterized protein n=1 Tax=Corallococcus caeni TaxID=3082388 RepID=A0ABQ6QU53_9BACT|nr:hypothetical protein ASNO1_38100 [Corallococcus sp. NO1]